MTTELAWAAGLFDGEGTVFASATLHGERRRVRLCAAVAMTTVETVQRFHSAVGVGAINGPYQKQGPRRKPQWIWRAGSEADVRGVIAAIWPWLSEPKRRQAVEAFAARDAHVENPQPLNLRKAFCRRGHEQAVHRRIHPGGKSHCVACQRITYVAWRDRNKGDSALFAEVAA